jgi:vacuolar-type H+-ATPase subunit F/Vma7
LKKIAFVTPVDAEYGFGLAGMSQYSAAPEGTEEILKKIMAEPDTGLIIIDERMLKGMSEEKIRDMEQRWEGILLVLPSPIKPSAGIEDYAERLIRKAVGYHVRLQR